MDPMPQIFLEDIGKIILSKDGKDVWLLKNLGQHLDFQKFDLPPEIFVVDFPAGGIGQRFLLGREICGPDKFFMIQAIGHALAQLCKRMGMFNDKQIAQFIILFGGEALNMHFAKPPLVQGAMIDSTYIKYQRVTDKNQPNGFRIERYSFAGQWWKDAIWLCLEECIASGSTVAHFIKEGFEQHTPEKLFVFPVCGSFFGIQEMYRCCKEKGVQLIPVFNSALIDVAPEGVKEPYTDLGLRPLTLTTRQFSARLKRRYLFTRLCWVGDIGDSIHRTKRYMLGSIDDMRLIGMDLTLEDWTRWNPAIFTERFRRLLKEIFPDTSRIFEEAIKKHK